MQAIDDAAVFAEAIGDRFVALLSDGSQRELLPGGAQLAVTFARRGDYVERVLEARLHESDLQIRAIQRGLQRVVPLPLLSILSWREASLMICGYGVTCVRRAPPPAHVAPVRRALVRAAAHWMALAPPALGRWARNVLGD